MEVGEAVGSQAFSILNDRSRSQICRATYPRRNDSNRSGAMAPVQFKWHKAATGGKRHSTNSAWRGTQCRNQMMPEPEDDAIPTQGDPLALFADWLRAAEKSEPNDPNAMALATA